MSILKAAYYDGKKSVQHPVSLILSGKILKVVGARIDVQADIRRVRRSLRIGNTPRWLYLPGGGACVTSDNDAVDRITRKRSYDRLLQRWENRPTLAALAVSHRRRLRGVFFEPAAARRLMTITGMSCSELERSVTNMHIASEAVSLSSFSDCRSSIALMPNGVAAASCAAPSAHRATSAR